MHNRHWGQVMLQDPYPLHRYLNIRYELVNYNYGEWYIYNRESVIKTFKARQCILEDYGWEKEQNASDLMK